MTGPESTSDDAAALDRLSPAPSTNRADVPDRPDTGPSDDQLSKVEEVLLGGPRMFTRDQAVSELDIDRELADEIWRAFGFAHDSRDEAIFTEDDLSAMGLVIVAYRSAPQGSAVAAARTIGQTMSRLADWQAYRLDELDRDPDFDASLAQMALAMGRVQTLIWRRHLAASLRNLNAARSGDEGEGHVLVVGFCDIVGYTSLSRKIGMHELNGLLESFEVNANDIIARHGGQIVKTLGDAVMFTADDPTEATLIGLELHSLSDRDEIPPLRVGLAYGRVLTRFGDVFGEPVNIAARLTGSARPGSSLCDATFADAVDDDRFFFKSIGSLSVRGYRHLKARVIEYNRKADSDE
ncbi:adenylate/guanylate cyclase domain-containing protein [Williamsia maris]|uniref:Adenylate cyclase n=1 Tax=Williamsia maris TaxID=72806 RepID=A0ABT1HF36_9NOCA|nr:adenylate/guanylate cyclase domain-containing protein [Williamsia maris]MCP2176345.1 adenylate cyclase [Williamsia maris]